MSLRGLHGPKVVSGKTRLAEHDVGESENVEESVNLSGIIWAISCPIVGAIMDILTRQVSIYKKRVMMKRVVMKR